MEITKYFWHYRLEFVDGLSHRARMDYFCSARATCNGLCCHCICYIGLLSNRNIAYYWYPERVWRQVNVQIYCRHNNVTNCYFHCFIHVTIQKENQANGIVHSLVNLMVEVEIWVFNLDHHLYYIYCRVHYYYLLTASCIHQ